jgi:putative flippase GtrA
MKFLRQLFLFGFVGSIGFLVDVAVLYILKESIGLYLGRLFSFTASVLVTWVLNRRVTFAERQSSKVKHHEFTLYFVLMCVGGSVNYSTYAFLLANFIFVQQQPVWGVAAGSIAGMFINLFSVSKLLFKIKSKHNGY